MLRLPPSPRPSLAREKPQSLVVLAFAALLLTVTPANVQAQGESQSLPEALSRNAPTLRFERLGLEDGLAQMSVQAMMQDRQGFLWFGTQAGLHRYDGHTFQVFAPTPFDTTSISGGSISDIAESATGHLWVGTTGEGLNRLDPATGRAVHYRHDPDDSTSLVSDVVSATLEASNGDLWVATSEEGLDRMRAGEDDVFEHFRHDPGDPRTLSNNLVSDLSEDAAGYIWVSTANGTNRIDPETGTAERFLFEPGIDVLNTEGRYATMEHYHPPDAPGVVWLATFHGLVRLDAETGDYERFLVEPNEFESTLNRLYEVLPDPNDPSVLWTAGPAAGVARFDMRSATFTTYRNDPQDAHSLSDNYVLRLLADRSGTMWVGTKLGGLNAFNPKSVDFVHLRHDPNDAQSLAPGTVIQLHEDRTGSLWVVTSVNVAEAYLTRFDAQTGRVTRYRHDRGDPASLQPGPMRGIAETSGHLWIGHWFPGGGLSRIDLETGSVERFSHEPVPANVRRNAISSLIPAQSDPDVLWIGTGDGLERLDTRTGTFERIALDLRAPVEEPFVIIIHHEDADGTLWATADGAGLMRVQDGALHLAAAYDARDTTSITHNEVIDILKRDDEAGTLWLATRTGLNRFDTRTGEATHYFEEDGLVNNFVYGIMEDERGTLWMSTNGGISNFNPETETFRNYGLDDGLIALEYNDAWAQGADGVMYFGSNEGVTAFSPTRMTTNATAPDVVLKTFKLFNMPVAVGPDSPLERPLAETERIRLAHDQNEVAFEFAALHYANPSKNQYAYRLEGFDEGWVKARGGQLTASYTNLPPGDYTFRVKAANPDGVWNEQGASVGLVITPPWWRTGWAYGLFTILFGLSAFGIDRTQRRRLSKKEAERAKVREAELRAEAQERRRQDAERLSEIGRAITSTLSTHQVIDTVYEHVNALMDAAVFGIGIYDFERDRLVFPATKENGKTLPSYTHDLGDESRPAVWCFEHRKPLVVGDYATEYQHYLPQRAPIVAGESTASIIYLPLVHQDKVVGVITTQSFERNAYTDYHVSVLKTLANYAAIAIDNAAAYRQLKTTQQQLVQQEKLASLGQLTAGIAHEIKNPLNFITNFAELNEELADELQEALTSGEDLGLLIQDLKQNAGVIKQHGRRADAIVKSMMAHARTGSGEREVVSFNALVDEHVELAFHGKRAQVPGFPAEVVRDYAPDTGEAEVVPQEIGRVVLNLATNAFDAVAEHALGQNGQYLPRVVVSTRRVEDQVELRIEDNGPGVSEEVRSKIFEPFFTTKSAGSGTGLGLSMSYDIITQSHGGTLEVEQAEGGGAAFVIRLPVSNPRIEAIGVA